MVRPYCTVTQFNKIQMTCTAIPHFTGRAQYFPEKTLAVPG